MYINNVSGKTSLRMIMSFAVLSLVITAAFIVFYLTMTAGVDYSVSGFFSWFVNAYKALLSENPEDPWVAWTLFIILPCIFYIGLIWSIVSRHIALREQASVLNLKSVAFLPDRVKFNFNRPQYNFICGYGDISNLEMVLNTTITRNKYGTYIVLNEIKLIFTVLNGKTFSLCNTPLNAMNFIYKIINYSRNINNFSYRFSGAGVQADIKEKIEDYLNKGIKPVLTSVGEANFKVMSIVFFIISIIFLIGLKDIFNDSVLRGSWFIFVPVGMFLTISFIFDIILVIDKIKEKSFRGYNG